MPLNWILFPVVKLKMSLFSGFILSQINESLLDKSNTKMRAMLHGAVLANRQPEELPQIPWPRPTDQQALVTICIAVFGDWQCGARVDGTTVVVTFAQPV